MSCWRFREGMLEQEVRRICVWTSVKSFQLQLFYFIYLLFSFYPPHFLGLILCPLSRWRLMSNLIVIACVSPLFPMNYKHLSSNNWWTNRRKFFFLNKTSKKESSALTKKRRLSILALALIDLEGDLMESDPNHLSSMDLWVIWQQIEFAIL